MRFYTVHMHRPVRDAQRDVVLVKEGFNAFAFLFWGLWALVGRLWLVALGLIALEVALNAVFVLAGLHPLVQVVLWLGFAMIVGFFGNDLHRWTLDRRDFLQMGVVSGRDVESAEQRFWDLRPQLAAEIVR